MALPKTWIKDAYLLTIGKSFNLRRLELFEKAINVDGLSSLGELAPLNYLVLDHMRFNQQALTALLPLKYTLEFFCWAHII